MPVIYRNGIEYSGSSNGASLSHSLNTVKVEDSDANIGFTETANGMNIDGQDEQGSLVCYAELTSKTYVDSKIASELDNFDHQDYEIVDVLPSVGEGGTRYLVKVIDDPGPPEEFHMEEYMYINGAWRDCGGFDSIKEATDSVAGIIKLNSDNNITLNSNGQLEIGGRMGKFGTTTGVYAPDDREPRMVADHSLLVTDAKGINMTGNRSLAVVSGLAVTCKSASAGATEYRVTNNYNNRIICKMAEGGYASKDEATSKVEQIVQVTSVTINGSSFTPDSSANGSNDIVITTAQTLNPDSAITSIRLFGTMGSYATIHTGNGIKSESGGRNLLLGGGVTKSGSSNDNCLIGNGIFSSGNGNLAVGRYHIAAKNRGFFAGTGHDSTNAPSEGASAVGQYSYMDSNTLFAVGNGTGHTARSNSFEVRTDGLVLKSPDGSRWKITVDNNGSLSTVKL